MARPISTRQEMSGALPQAGRLTRAVAVAGAGLGAALLVGAVALWFHYGTTVFFETIASGLSACF